MTWDTSAPLKEIQRGLVSILNTPLSGKIYNELPEDVELPYTCIESMAGTETGAKKVLGYAVLVVLKTYGRDSGGSEEVTGIQETIVEKLSTNKLSMTDWVETRKEPTNVNVRKEPKDPGIAYEALTAFMIYVQRSRA